MSEEKTTSPLAKLEALLFLHGEPLGITKIAELLDLGVEETERLIADWEKKLMDAERGLTLVHIGDRIQLVTKSAFGRLVESFVRAELTQDLTPAATEALAIIAYLGPIVRSRIEYLRGVNSAVTLRNLLIRGLVERVPDPERPHVSAYQVTADLLRHLGLRNVEDLPELTKFRTALAAVAEPVPADTTQHDS